MKCKRCPIRKECLVWALKQVDEKGNVGSRICPLVWVITQHIKELPKEKEYLKEKHDSGWPPSQPAARSGVRLA